MSSCVESNNLLELLLVRHAATKSNEQHRYIGRRTDEPLSDAGRIQCSQVGEFPQVKKAYASPMLRAQQTAQLLFPHAEIETVAGLEEYDFGDFEGQTASEMTDNEAYRIWVQNNCISQCPHGDSRATYTTRTNTALVRLLCNAWNREEGSLVVVAHGGTIMAAMTALCDSKRDYFEWHVDNVQGCVAQVFFDTHGEPHFLNGDIVCDLADYFDIKTHHTS